MKTVLVTALVLAPLVALAAPAVVADDCPAEASLVATPVLYADAWTGPTSTSVRVLNLGVEDRIVHWQLGAHSAVWLETNGVAGLQRGVGPCGAPADTYLAEAHLGFGRATIIL